MVQKEEGKPSNESKHSKSLSQLFKALILLIAIGVIVAIAGFGGIFSPNAKPSGTTSISSTIIPSSKTAHGPSSPSTSSTSIRTSVQTSTSTSTSTILGIASTATTTATTTLSTSTTTIPQLSIAAPIATTTLLHTNQSQSSTITDSGASGGHPPYFYQWLEMMPGQTSFSNAANCVNPGSATCAFTTSYNTPTGIYSLELKATDASFANVTSSMINITVVR